MDKTDAARQKCPAAFFRSQTGSHLQNSMQRGILKTTEKDKETKGNTAQSPPVGYAQHLLTNFPSYHTETPCNTPVFLRRFYAI
ncbi:hypothetical protein [uncultured Ruminococcus sp.]|uniref:hypothetical protein n=1 Tax=uncultured Ruminococcus sp. TaxID=165186 RepID=UPI002598965A|nr:hypothetical protein [uncultured Ruminococcus sp.]